MPTPNMKVIRAAALQVRNEHQAARQKGETPSPETLRASFNAAVARIEKQPLAKHTRRGR